MLDHGQVSAIQHLVAAAVAGLEPNRVAIVDDQRQSACRRRRQDRPGCHRRRRGTAHHRFRGPSAPAHRIHRRQRRRAGPCARAGHRRHELPARQRDVARPTIPTARSCAPPRPSSRTRPTANASGANSVSVANALPTSQPDAGGSDNTKSSADRTEETTNYEISKTVKTSTIDGGDSEAAVGRRGRGRCLDHECGGRCQIQAAHASRKCSRSTAWSNPPSATTKRAAIRCRSSTWRSRASTRPMPRLRPPRCSVSTAYWFKIIEAAILSLTALLIGLFVVRPLIGRMFAPCRRRVPRRSS